MRHWRMFADLGNDILTSGRKKLLNEEEIKAMNHLFLENYKSIVLQELLKFAISWDRIYGSNKSRCTDVARRL